MARLIYMSYTAKITQLTQRYDNTYVYFYDREYRKLQTAQNVRWGTDIPHLQTMQLALAHPATTSAGHKTHQSPPISQHTTRGLFPLMVKPHANCLTQQGDVCTLIVNFHTHVPIGVATRSTQDSHTTNLNSNH